MPLLLGIDTGGTFTDAVLLDEGRGVVAKAKALTTHRDLAEGIGAALEAVLAGAGPGHGPIALVSLSTTLATNAMVEGQGGRVGLILIGFDPADAERPELKAALKDDPVILVAGGHDPFGSERAPLDARALAEAARAVAGHVTGFAVTGRFAALNPAHEVAARALLRGETGLPVTCGHDLSTRLDGPKRALTALFNARLVHLIARLIEATEARLARAGIAAPVMVVRGDGALVSAAVARAKPIETIFSGPAASAVGGAYLAGTGDAIVADIGGTTTDVVVLREGRPRIDPEGAVIGGFRTMVDAIAIRTCGLGGDSEVRLEQHGLDATLALGPRRLVPVSLLARSEADLVHATLDRQHRAEHPGELDGRFVLPLASQTDGLPAPERALLDRLGDRAAAADRLIASRRDLSALNRLAARRLVMLAGLTPSDAAHCLGLHEGWDKAAARAAATLFARKRNALGRAVAPGADALAETIVETLRRRSAEFVLDCAFAEDGIEGPDLARHPLAARAIDRRAGLARLALTLAVPVVGLGASAATYYPAIAEKLGAVGLVPEHAEVANAVGAVVGGVHATAAIRVLQPAEGLYRVLGSQSTHELSSESDALALAADLAAEEAAKAALAAGAATAETTVSTDVRKALVEGRDLFVEATVTGHARGRPRVG